jgi:glycerol-3-phosphate acyltransferase PlsY
MFGVILPWQPLIAVAASGVWLLALWLWRYVSVASMLAGVSLPLSAWWLGSSTACLAASSLFCLLMIIRHHSNIKGLLNGTEDKIGGKCS